MALLLVVSEGWKLDANAVVELAQQDLRPALLDTDLKQVGAPCLPVGEKNIGRLVLQVASVDNIGESRKSDRGKRMLRLKLTDGHSTVTAVEYRPVPFLSQDVAPGTKVLIKNARLQNGILLLDDRCIQVLGGRVSILYEAWEIERKYSASGRTTSQKPPVFGVAQTSTDAKVSSPSSISTTVSPPSSSTTKVTRVILESSPEAGPAQNQAAARKLLDKKSDHSLQPRRRRQGRETQSFVTLDEWEAKKSGSREVESDEELARKLQKELDMENESTVSGEAERIRLSMFSFSREEANKAGGGRGRGRGRGRRR